MQSIMILWSPKSSIQEMNEHEQESIPALYLARSSQYNRPGLIRHISGPFATYDHPPLRQQPLGRPRVVRREMDARQVKIPRHHTVQPNTAAAVGGDTGLPENVDVLLDARAGGVDALGADALLELDGVVDALPAGTDLLPAHEQIVRVGDLGVGGVLLGVEGTGRLGELVEHVEVGAVLLADEGAKRLLLRRAHVLVVADVAELLGTLLAEELLAFGKGQAHLLVVIGEEELLRGVDGADEGDFLGAALLDVAEDVEKDAFEHVLEIVSDEPQIQ